MRQWFQSLDAILRGEATKPEQLRGGRFEIPAGGLTVLIALLGASYGLCMACYSVFNRPDPQYQQLLASAIKVPALFLLTLAITLPSLYVFNALIGSRLSGASVVRLLVASLGVILAVLASLGPIVAFFSLTTTSYPFMKILNVLVFALSGGLGLRFTMQTLQRLTKPERIEPADDGIVYEEDARKIARRSASSVRTVFFGWVVVFGLVGAQMSWVLRPFIGDPERPFEWFRARESNFFDSVRQALLLLFA